VSRHSGIASLFWGSDFLVVDQMGAPCQICVYEHKKTAIGFVYLMKQYQQKIFQFRYSALFILIICGLYYNLFIDRAYVELEIKVEKETPFKIYWAEKGKPYQERKSVYVRVQPDREEYGFLSIDLKNVERLRIDPVKYKGKCVIKKIVFKQKGLKEIVLASESDFSLLRPMNQIVAQHFDDNGFTVFSGGEDPYFEFRPQIRKGDFDWFGEFSRLMFIVIIASFFVFFCSCLLENFRFVPLCIVAVLIMITVMAVISNIDVHPDESVHIPAVEYYSDHWLPPVIEDPEIIDSYSCYGFSRLNTHEIYYFVAGKLKKIFSFIHLPDYILFRLINVLFFSIILVYTIKIPQARTLALPLLISPQIWYIFSYVNGDAFGLLLSFLAGCQLLLPESMFNRFLYQDDKKIFQPILLAILLALILLLKKNYLFFSAFLFFCVVLKVVWQEDRERQKSIIKRLAVIVLIGVSLVGLRFGADYYVNGFDRSDKLEQAREKYAYYPYNPNTELKDQHPMLYLKKRGYTLNNIVSNAHWFEKTFRSFFGIYGYHTITASSVYYDLVKKIAIIFAAFFFLSVFIRSGLRNNLLTLSLLFLAAVLIGASLIHSWVSDFQSQGRYLFPIIPMLGLLYGMSGKSINHKLTTIFVSILFIFSAYSFIFLGLFQIPKAVFY